MKDVVLQILEENGIYIPEDLDEPLDMDSITFISIMVCFETKLNISIPEEYLSVGRFRTIQNFIDNITELSKGNK